MIARPALLVLVTGLCIACDAGPSSAGAAPATDGSTGGAPSGGEPSDETSDPTPPPEATGSTSADTPDPATGGDPGDEEESTPSSACGDAPLAPGMHTELPLTHDGRERSYDLFVPPTHDGVTPAPLIVNLHGWTVTPAGQAAFSQLNATAADRGFAVAYPAGVDESWNGTLCCGTAHAQQLDDVGFVRAVVERLDQTLCFDRKRVFAIGHSNGGFLAHRLACEAADVFAAVAGVAATLPVSPSSCVPIRPIPVMHQHGTADPIVAYEGGGFIGHPSAMDSAAGWAERNDCDPAPNVVEQVDDVTCLAWTGCAAGSEVQLCSFEGMGHCWPGNPSCTQGAPSVTRHGSELAADFFEAHPAP